MKLDEIQPNLLTLLQAMSMFAAAQDKLLIDDGNQLKVMEGQLTDDGLSLLIMPPQCIGLDSEVWGAAKLEYSSTIWIRTNPKFKTANVPTWNPLTIEAALIKKVLSFGQSPNCFRLTSGLEPETDFTDLGNNSRLIRFSTTVIL
jgi:hypothetical protein